MPYWVFDKDSRPGSANHSVSVIVVATLPNERIRGFQESRTILTALELDLFTALGQGTSAGAVANAIGTDPRATRCF